MSIVRNRNALQFFVHSLLIYAALIYGPLPALAQTAGSSREQAWQAQSVSDTSPSSDQSSGDQQQPSTRSVLCGVTHLGQWLKDIGHDQAGIWTSPLRVSPRDGFWLVPFAAARELRSTTTHKHNKILESTRVRIDTSNIVSGFGSPYATLGGAAGVYFLGLGTHNEKIWRAVSPGFFIRRGVKLHNLAVDSNLFREV